MDFFKFARMAGRRWAEAQARVADVQIAADAAQTFKKARLSLDETELA